MSVLLPVMLFLEKDYLIQQLLQKIQSEKRLNKKNSTIEKIGLTTKLFKTTSSSPILKHAMTK